MSNTKNVRKTKPVPKPKQEIGIDTENTLINNILDAAQVSRVDISELENLSTVSRNRETMYQLIDSMAQDSTVSAILETYAEDVCEPNDQGRVMWVESSDAEVAKYITYLLDTTQVDKHAYGWAHSLIKNGDMYLRLYRESDYEKDTIFNNYEKETLNEDVNIKVTSKNDNYIHYLELVSNPGEMFDLTKFGKTYGYIQAPVNVPKLTNGLQTGYDYLKYKVKKNDVNIYPANSFVHAILDDNSSRTDEEVSIFLDETSYEADSDGSVYKVRRGQSLLYNLFKVWRELTLLENSVLLNRLTKSSIVRIIGVEVGDMPKENIAAHLQSIKSMIEQKSAINEATSMSNYTNPGPVENNIYVPTHNGIGRIETQQVGGDVDPKQLTDLEYYRDKFYAGTRVPKQFFGQTDDAAGFNGGSSLSIISSRYAKAVKRIQNALIQAVTDAFNLMLLDKGLTSYVNKFKLRMTTPLTQEEIDRRDNISNRIRVASDIMQSLSDVSNPATRLKIIKSLLSTVISDTEVISLIQEEIDSLEKEGKETTEETRETPRDETEREFSNLEEPREMPSRMNADIMGTEEQPTEEPETTATEPEQPQGGENDYLPRPSALGMDFTGEM